MTTLKAERLDRGKEVSRGVFEALRSELNIAKRYIEPKETNTIEGEMFKGEAEIEVQSRAKAREHLAHTFFQVTTVSNEHVGLLADEDLI